MSIEDEQERLQAEFDRACDSMDELTIRLTTENAALRAQLAAAESRLARIAKLTDTGSEEFKRRWQAIPPGWRVVEAIREILSEECRR